MICCNRPNTPSSSRIHVTPPLIHRFWVSRFFPFRQGNRCSKGSTLQVHVNYTAAGTVDDAHKLYVALWDTPDFVKDGASGTTPIAMKFVTDKSEVAEFTDLDRNPVFLSMAFDPRGKWDAQSDPPSGTSLGLYSTEPGVPAPIQLDAGRRSEFPLRLTIPIRSLNHPQTRRRMAMAGRPRPSNRRRSSHRCLSGFSAVLSFGTGALLVDRAVRRTGWLRG